MSITTVNQARASASSATYAARISRYYLAGWHLLCVIDGWLYLLFGIDPLRLTRFSGQKDPFFQGLITTTWFWVLLKIVQTFATYSLLFNYRPALGFVLMAPITLVICCFYIFNLHHILLTPVAILMLVATLVLANAYTRSFKPLLDRYD